MRSRILMLLVLLTISTAAFAATPPAMLRFGTDKPEALLSFSWTISNPGALASKATMTPFTFVKAINASSKRNYDACNSGQHFPQVTIDLLDTKGNSVAQVKLSDVVVTSYTVGPGPTPVETVTLGYDHADYIITGY